MALSLEQLLLVATDLTLALALSSLLYAVGCLGFAGLLGYVVILSSGILQKATRNIRQKKREVVGNIRQKKRAVARNISQKKDAVVRTVWKSCLGQMVARILGLVGFRVEALCPSGRAPTLKEDCPSSLEDPQLPGGEKKCQEAAQTLSGSRLCQTGTSGGMKKWSGRRWEEERDDPQVPFTQKKIFRIPAFLLSLLFAPLNWCLKRRCFHRLTTRLTTLKKPRN